MVHVITHDDTYPISGRVVLIGDRNTQLGDFRLLFRIMTDTYGPDTIIKAICGAKLDDISRVDVVFKDKEVTHGPTEHD